MPFLSRLREAVGRLADAATPWAERVVVTFREVVEAFVVLQAENQYLRGRVDHQQTRIEHQQTQILLLQAQNNRLQAQNQFLLEMLNTVRRDQGQPPFVPPGGLWP